MSDDCWPRIGDFGLARSFSVREQIEMSTGIGTPLFMAPEASREDEYDLSVDVFAWSFIFWMLITEKELFFELPKEKKKGLLALTEYIQKGGRPRIECVTNPAQKELLVRCWNANPSLRLTFSEILQDPDKLIIDGCRIEEFNAYKDEILKIG
jgi:serine/threonine protein kinase